MPDLKHSCQDKRLIKKIVLTDGMFMYQTGNPSKNTQGRQTEVAASRGRETFCRVSKMKCAGVKSALAWTPAREVSEGRCHH